MPASMVLNPLKETLAEYYQWRTDQLIHMGEAECGELAGAILGKAEAILAGARMGAERETNWDRFMEFNSLVMPIAGQLLGTYISSRGQQAGATAMASALQASGSPANQTIARGVVLTEGLQASGFPVAANQAMTANAIASAYQRTPQGQVYLSQAEQSLLAQADAAGIGEGMRQLLAQRSLSQAQQQQAAAGMGRTAMMIAIPLGIVVLGVGVAIFIARPKEVRTREAELRL